MKGYIENFHHFLHNKMPRLVGQIPIIVLRHHGIPKRKKINPTP